jgi:AcrR family transcriptional regulator
MQKFTKLPRSLTKKICSDHKSYSIFGKNYDLPFTNKLYNTKKEILLVATVLFALKGYNSVSIRDVATIIGIKASSIYNHYTNKEELWKRVITHSMKMFLIYIHEIDKNLEDHNKINDMLGVIFYEPKKMKNLFPCFAFGVIQRERIYNEFAGKIFAKMCTHTIKILTRHFNRCIDINININTDFIAMICLSMVFFGINTKVHDIQQNTYIYDYAALYEGIQKILVMGAKI